MTTIVATEDTECSQTAPWIARMLQLPDETAVELVVTRLNVGPAAAEAALTLLSGDEWQRARRFAFEAERRRFIVTRAMLRRLLGAQLGIRPEAVELVYGQHGKPALPPGSGTLPLNFNLSHSHDLAVFAFACGRQVGVDIERIRPMPDADQIARQFFSPSEHVAYRSLAPADQALGFFNAWTRKEAFTKALGDGLYHPLDDFDISLLPDEPARICRVGPSAGENCGWTLDSFQPAPGFVGAIVVQASAAGSLPSQPLRVH